MQLPENFEQTRWGGFRNLTFQDLDDGKKTLTKEIFVAAGAGMSYQKHFKREEIWIFAGGDGRIVFEGEERAVTPGEVLVIPKEKLHCVKAVTDLYFVEVQIGEELDDDDIARFEWNWSE